MQMTKGDICKSYKEAKRKKAQVQILAELNQCSPDYIKEILKAEGVWQTPGPKPGVKPKAVEPTKDERQDALVETAHYGLESIEAKIIESERLIEEIEKKLNRLKEIRKRTQNALGEIEATSTDASL